MSGADDIAFAHRLADAAGNAIRPFFRSAFQTERKGDRSPVTEADRAAERAMRDLIEAERPDDGILGEEFGATNMGAARRWVLDPIDGTVSFMAGRPIFGTLVALLEDGWPVLGIIDQPIAGERWTARTGQDATLNGLPARTRHCSDLKTAALATSAPHYFNDEDGARFVALARQADPAALIYGGDCYNYGLLASGHIDLVVETGLKLHDFAALVPIIEAAGGMMCDWAGDPLNADSAGDVLALGDPARLEDVLEILN
ncbi:MAG: histidinol-phosphatase [Pseudomonadota bacterium]